MNFFLSLFFFFLVKGDVYEIAIYNNLEVILASLPL